MGRTESCSVFGDVRVLVCSVCTGFTCDIMRFCKSLGKVDFVEKMWESLRKKLWVDCGKVLHWVVDKLVLHILGERFARFGGDCGKICKRFAHIDNRDNGKVLHIFHIAYYYNYYFI